VIVERRQVADSRALHSLALAVGRTPLVRLQRIERQEGLGAAVQLYAKLEGFNPGGSVKDRPALQMVLDALQSGRLRKGMAVMDSTSGNTGVAYSWIGAALGIPVVLVMPENVTTARKRICRAYGAQIVYSDPLEGSDGAIRLARELAAQHADRYLYVDQYSNESNPKAHYLGTGREIWQATSGTVTHFVAGLGTSGTLMGTGRRLREENPEVQVIAVQPDDSFHGLEGLKHLETSIVPGIYREGNLDATLFVGTDEGWAWAERLGRIEGVLVGHSSGAALAGALRVARGLRDARKGGTVVVLFPDRAERYIEPEPPAGHASGESR
jgi:cysteine synthase B